MIWDYKMISIQTNVDADSPIVKPQIRVTRSTKVFTQFRRVVSLH